MIPGTSRGLPLFIPDHCPKWVRCPMSNNDLTSALRARGGKGKVFPRLAFSPNETLFIPINRHVIWKSPFYSGVPIGYCLHNCLMTGWFKCLQYLQVKFRYLGFHQIVTRRLVISLVSCDSSRDFCWRFNDVFFMLSWLIIMSFDWL